MNQKSSNILPLMPYISPPLPSPPQVADVVAVEWATGRDLRHGQRDYRPALVLHVRCTSRLGQGAAAGGAATPATGSSMPGTHAGTQGLLYDVFRAQKPHRRASFGQHTSREHQLMARVQWSLWGMPRGGRMCVTLLVGQTIYREKHGNKNAFFNFFLMHLFARVTIHLIAPIIALLPQTPSQLPTPRCPQARPLLGCTQPPNLGGCPRQTQPETPAVKTQ